MGKFLPGHKKVGGRKPGSPRRSIASQFRELSMQVFSEIGGLKKYSEWAKAHPTVFYTFLSKTIPAEATLNMNAHVVVDDLDNLEIARRINYVLAQIAAAAPRAIEMKRDVEDATIIETGNSPVSAEQREAILARPEKEFSEKDGAC